MATINKIRKLEDKIKEMCLSETSPDPIIIIPKAWKDSVQSYITKLEKERGWIKDENFQGHVVLPERNPVAV